MKATVTQVNVDGDNACFALQDEDYNNYIIYDNRQDKSANIIDGDTIIVYGVFQGLKDMKYLSSGAETKIPSIDVKYLSFPDEKESFSEAEISVM